MGIPIVLVIFAGRTERRWGSKNQEDRVLGTGRAGCVAKPVNVVTSCYRNWAAQFGRYIRLWGDLASGERW